MIATAASTSTACRARGVSPRALLAGLLALALALVAQTALAAPAEALTGVDLSTYKRVGRIDLPEPTRTTPPANNLLGQEASGVTYDWDTDSLFIVGDGGTSVTQVSKTGALIDTMTLPPGGSPQGTEFYDTEGIAYIGGGEFVMTEERDRQAVRFTYEAGGTLTREEADTVKLGTEIGNVGLEGLTNDPVTGGYIFVKEMDPRSIFQTGIDWEAGTATNGGPEAVSSTDLFNPALTGLIDLSDVFALANLSTLTGPQTNNLLIISQESGKVINVDRSGNVSSSLTLVKDPGNPLSIQQQTHEGVTMDDDGVLYTVNESGGGDADHPQLWVFEPSSEPNQAPTAVTLTDQTTSLPENTNTSTRLKLAEVVVTDDGIGTNQYSVTGPDASFFEVDSSGLYLKAGTVLNAATKSAYQISVQVQDTTVSGSSPVTSSPYTLTITSTSGGSAGTAMAVTEISPWSSGNSPYAADWWELTNTGTKAVDLTGWRVDDDSASFGSAIALSGVTSLAPGESAIFIEGNAATADAFKTHWFGASPPAGFKIGTYSGSGIGLSTGGDHVSVFNAGGTRVTGVAFGSSTSGQTFDNTAALGATTPPLPAISTLSVAGVNGAKTVSGETGSPGVATVPTPVIVSEVAPWGSGDPTYGADWWELTNNTAQTLDLSGWKIDDESNAFGSAIALNGVSALAPGQSAIFVEGDSAKATAFKTFWFGSSVPAAFLIGTYSGSGIGFGTGGDQVNVFNSAGNHLTGVKFGSATTNFSFDNAAGLGSFAAPPPTISTLSKEGVNGAFKVHDQVGSPGTIAAPPPPPAVKITEVSPTGSSGSYGADWWELTNTGTKAVDPSTYKVDDESNAFGSSLALSGVTSLAAGESAIFLEGDSAKATAFRAFWFGGSPPAGLQVGTYSGSGIGFGSGGDQVNLFDSAGAKTTGVRFGAATTGVSFDNAAGIGGTETPPPLISTLSAVGVNGAFAAGSEVGSPGTIVQPAEFALTVSVGGTGSGKVTSSPPGIDCGSTCEAEFEEGTVVALTGAAGANSKAVVWSGCDSVNGENECLVTMSTAKSVTATFDLEPTPKHKLTVSQSGAGSGTVTSSPAGIDCGGTCSAEFEEGSTVTLSQSAEPGSEFKEWTGACSGAGTCEVTMSEAKSVNARFAHTKQVLSLSKSGSGAGAIRSKPKGVACGNTCATAVAKYYKNTVVVLTEKPAAGSTFTEWTGACSGSGETCTVTMSAAKSVTAVFGGATKAIVNPQVLTVSKAAGTGYGTVKGTGLACELDCTQTQVAYFGGETAPPAKKAKPAATVTLTALAGIGSSFSGWTGCDEEAEGKCVVGMSAAHSVSAQFNALPAKALSLTKVGYGTIKSNPRGLSCGNTCASATASLPEGTVVVLTQKAGTGSTFTEWTGACSGSGETCTVTLSEAKSATATFSAAVKPIVNPQVLTVSKAGTGKGRVQGTGLVCELDCTQTTVPYFGGETAPPAKKAKPAATVTLTATPAAGSDPVIWSGCETVEGNVCKVLMSKAQSVTARFEE